VLGTPMVCPPSDECHDFGTCDANSGTCTDPAKTDGEPCTGGTCRSGKCVLGGTGGTTGGTAGAGGTAPSGGGPGAGGSVQTGGAAGVGGATTNGTSGSGTTDAGARGPSNLYARNPGGCACGIEDADRDGTGPWVAIAIVTFSMRRRSRGAARPAHRGTAAHPT
jgi:MYXO-CTERM domain-containing protein